MKLRTLFFLLLIVVIAIFAAINWTAFMAPTTLSLGFASIQAPLGLVMLGLLTFITAIFLIFVAYLTTSVLLETRRQAKEVQLNRDLADKAEASRFTELHGYLEGILTNQAEVHNATTAALLSRLERLEQEMRVALEQSGNTLAAHIGQLEDRLERGQGLSPRPN